MRLVSLWIEVLRCLDGEVPPDGPTKNLAIKSMPVQDGRRNPLLASWRLLLDQELAAAIDSADVIESDIRQLQALCDQQISTAFLPV